MTHRSATAILCFLVLLPQIALAGLPSYAEQAQQEIEQYRKIQLEEKKIEVLARLKMLGAPQTFTSASSNTALHSSNKSYLNSSASSSSEVTT